MKKGFSFLPYQAAWIKDNSRFKIAEKSRRTGFTFAQAYEDVRDAARDSDAMDVWFSSVDETAAREYIINCKAFAAAFDLAARDQGEIVIDDAKGRSVKVLSLEFATGKRINALTSSPKAFRSKGGKLVLDEFAWHEDGDAMWKAARPIVTWGYPVRLISTHHGKANRYYRLLQAAMKQGSIWSRHRVTIHDAVNQGLIEKITGSNRKWSKKRRDAWIAAEREATDDDDVWQEEYCCEAQDETTAWLTWAMINACQHDEAGEPRLYRGGETYVGMDIGRRRDLAVIWVIEMVGDVAWTREVIPMPKTKFSHQLKELDRVMAQYNVRRACLDQTGMGEAVVEMAQEKHGSYRVEGVLFTAPTKQDLATVGRKRFEDRTVRIPKGKAIERAHHSIKKIITTAGNIRFDAERSEKTGHADEFWAHMLALHAAGDVVQPAAGESVEPEADAYKSERRADRRRSSMFGRRGATQ